MSKKYLNWFGPDAHLGPPRQQEAQRIQRETIQKLSRDLGQKSAQSHERRSAETVERLNRGLAEKLAREAAKGHSPIGLDYPTLDARMRHDAMLASALLHTVRRDPAEADPDPDYGL